MRKIKIKLLLITLLLPVYAYAENGEMNELLLRQIKEEKGISKEERLDAIDRLGLRGIKATQESAMELIPLLDSEDEEIQRAVIRALGNMKWEAKRAVPKLMDIMYSNTINSHLAADALIKIGSVDGREAAEKYLENRRSR